MTNPTTTVATVDAPLAGLLMVRQLIRIIGGNQKVDIGGNKPPSTCYQDGNIRYIATDAMRPMINVRKAVERKAAALGFKLAGSWAIPLDCAKEMIDEIDLAEKKFATERAYFEAEFDARCAAFAAEQPAEWRHLLNTRPSAAQAAARCSFAVGVCQFTAPSVGANRFEDLVQSAVPAMLSDIARNADEIWEKSVKGKSQINQRTVNRVRELVVKLESFSMLDTRVSPCVASYQTLLSALPASGPLTTAETAEVGALLSVLSNPERILAHGQALFSAAPGLRLDRDDDSELTPAPTAQDDTNDAAYAAAVETVEAACGDDAGDPPPPPPARTLDIHALL